MAADQTWGAQLVAADLVASQQRGRHRAPSQAAASGTGSAASRTQCTPPHC